MAASAASHRDEAEAVHHEGGRGAVARHQQARRRGADHAGAVEHRRVQRDGVHEIAAGHQVGDVGLARRHVERGGEAVEGGEHRDVPELHVAAPDQGRQREGLQHERGLRAQEQPPLAHPIADRPGEEREEQDGAELERADQAEAERRVRQLQHEPRLPDALHPRADEGDELSAPEQPEVPVAEGAQPGGKDHSLYCAMPLARLLKGAPVVLGIVLGLVAGLAWVGATPSSPGASPAPGGLAQGAGPALVGQFLVATEALRAPAFARTVIYMVRARRERGDGAGRQPARPRHAGGGPPPPVRPRRPRGHRQRARALRRAGRARAGLHAAHRRSTPPRARS